MNNRLQQFLELENLTPSQFADMLGIQRSGVSHILSGRNNPSYDFISKFLSKFPNANIEWVLNGKGKPYKEFPLPSSSATTSTTQKNNSQSRGGIQYPNLPYNGIQNGSIQNNDVPYNNVQNNSIQYNNVQYDAILSTSDTNENSTLDQNKSNNTLSNSSNPFLETFLDINTEMQNNSNPLNSSTNTNNQQVTSDTTAPQLNENELNAKKSNTTHIKRSIKRVIVFYSDGSFEELFPNR